MNASSQPLDEVDIDQFLLGDGIDGCESLADPGVQVHDNLWGTKDAVACLTSPVHAQTDKDFPTRVSPIVQTEDLVALETLKGRDDEESFDACWDYAEEDRQQLFAVTESFDILDSTCYVDKFESSKTYGTSNETQIIAESKGKHHTSIPLPGFRSFNEGYVSGSRCQKGLASREMPGRQQTLKARSQAPYGGTSANRARQLKGWKSGKFVLEGGELAKHPISRTPPRGTIGDPRIVSLSRSGGKKRESSSRYEVLVNRATASRASPGLLPRKRKPYVGELHHREDAQVFAMREACTGYNHIPLGTSSRKKHCRRVRRRRAPRRPTRPVVRLLREATLIDQRTPPGRPRRLRVTFKCFLATEKEAKDYIARHCDQDGEISLEQAKELPCPPGREVALAQMNDPES